MKTRPLLLQQVMSLAAQHKKVGPQLQTIFDLDSTLFDVSPRISRILHAFAAQEEIKAKYPWAAAALAKVKPQPQDYGVRRTLERCGFNETHEEVIRIMIPYWKKYFFGNDYLKYDVPYPGAVSFVKDLHAAGARILYLTGRDVPRMFEGTVSSLKQWEFPLDADFSNLILKPSTDESDHEFKRDFFIKMERTPAEVWFFENEPTNIELVMKHSPHIKQVFVETVHSGKTPPPGAHIPRIRGFEE